MAALNQSETENLSIAERAMSDTVSRLRRLAQADDTLGVDKTELDFMIDNLTKAKGLVNSVKQMKGYYPK